MSGELNRIIRDLDEHHFAELPGGAISTAGDLAYLLRELLTIGLDVERFLLGPEVKP